MPEMPLKNFSTICRLKFPILSTKKIASRMPDGKGVQLRIAEDVFNKASVNVYRNTNSVLVQPHDSPEAVFVRTLFALRVLELRRRGKIG